MGPGEAKCFAPTILFSGAVPDHGVHACLTQY